MELTCINLRITDYDAFVDETLTLLREHDFEPDRVDRRHGTIVAGPTVAGQWFEFWRGDVHGPYQMLEANLHTIRRTATVTIEPLHDASSQPAPDSTPPGSTAPPATAPESHSPDGAEPRGGDFRVSVTVEKSRLSAPERQVTTSSGILGIYSERLPTEEGHRGPRSAGEHWVPLGRDGLLEAHFVGRLAALPHVDSTVEP